ncbi:probable 2' cyclic ADP-D-ribose synthase BdTIR [Cryptomeria japonica]|uniref:probable 2' cyclic ADP-D-ribose synthase BdTIR n=1 Tax=Cryptomeria japonica TaxID=3369 RepID=UPI0027DA25FF|nr:probable 2' cyclic ADP-D-ribose synthase BdTIR [Cryptomeria japonica]
MARGNEITNSAFTEMLPPSVSFSSPKEGVSYEVFISHRGPDTKETLAASIYHALKLMGLQVFLDKPEFELGNSIPSKILEAICTSFLHVAILSPGYAESTWCLEELSLMLKTGQTIIPVFYNVNPSDIHWISKEPFAEAFCKHEATKRYSPEKVKDWKSALQQVSYLIGPIVNSEE